MSDVAAMVEWRAYSEEQPPKEGPYRWRVPSVAVPGLIVLCVAHMRERGAGYVRAVSPVFDYWDGYRLHVPAGTQWQEVDPATVKGRWCDVTDVRIEGHESCACPYCGKVPTLKAMCRSEQTGGVFATDDPHRFNSWTLECCAWARTPAFKDPRELIAKRNSVIAQLAKEQTP